MLGFLRQRSLGKKRKPPSTIDELVRREFGLRVRKRVFYDEALRHSSMLDGDTTGAQSNERLEFLGDAVLDLAVAAHLFASFPREQEGPLTQRKSRIVNRKTLNLLGERMGIQHLIEVRMRRKDINDSMLGNALEALIGALYLDHGYRKANSAVLRMIRRYGMDEKVHETVDFKSKLYHWTQKRRLELEFVVTQERPNGSETEYEMEARVDGKAIGMGSGGSKKIAEQAAARVAWKSVYEGDLDNIDEGGDSKSNTSAARGSRNSGRGRSASRSRSTGASRKPASSSRDSAKGDAQTTKSRRESTKDAPRTSKPRSTGSRRRKADSTSASDQAKAPASEPRRAPRAKSPASTKSAAAPSIKPSNASSDATDGRPRGATGRRRAKPATPDAVNPAD